MSVIRTDAWLLESYDKPIEICEKIMVHFNGVSSYEIQDHLTLYGMYEQPIKNGYGLVKKLQGNKVWEMIEMEEKKLQKLWRGPDIPIFILPSDTNNQKLQHDYNGRSGLAFKDKLFLFVSDKNEEMEIKTLFTHEYNHICRLSTLPKQEADYVLLDTIILEGLAENAVRERFGNQFLADWTSDYSNEALERMWKEIVFPNKNTPKGHYKHQEILYGSRFYPKMVGYCVGFYLVKKYIEERALTIKDLLDKPSKEIAQIELTL